MRKLIRSLAVLALTGGLIGLMPTTAYANHDDTPNSPGPHAGRGTPGDNAAGWHEEMPDMAVAGTEHVCEVSGGVDGGPPPVPSVGHNPFPPAGVDDPAHNHFVFIQTVITCDDGAVNVTAEGGNDGHVMQWEPAGGAPEADGIGPNCVFDHPVNAPNGRHHGAMTESGWSHSSDYSGGSASCATAESNGGNQGACRVPPAGAGNNNKADIIIDPVGPAPAVGGFPNFVKYVRVGNIVYYWGCSEAFAAAPYTAHPVFGSFARRFSGVLAIVPDPQGPTFPLCLLPELVAPGTPGCDLALVGGGTRSNAWAQNGRP